MNVAEVFAVRPEGPLPIVVSGAVVSTVSERLAGVGSATPAASMARTSNVRAPSASAAVVCGDVHAAKAAVPTRHWNVEPVSLELNVNVGVLSFVSPVGPAGDRRVRRRGVDHEGPRGRRRRPGYCVLTARTENVYGPSASPVYGCAFSL